jgi:hypothetical protein
MFSSVVGSIGLLKWLGAITAVVWPELVEELKTRW